MRGVVEEHDVAGGGGKRERRGRKCEGAGGSAELDERKRWRRGGREKGWGRTGGSANDKPMSRPPGEGWWTWRRGAAHDTLTLVPILIFPLYPIPYPLPATSPLPLPSSHPFPPFALVPPLFRLPPLPLPSLSLPSLSPLPAVSSRILSPPRRKVVIRWVTKLPLEMRTRARTSIE